MHQFYYQLLMIIRNKALIFWSSAFPVLLGTLFYFTFGGISKAEWKTVPAAVVEQENNAMFSLFLEEMEKAEEKEANPMLKLKYMTEEEAQTALESGEIDGIYYVAKTPSLMIRKNGIPASVLEGILTAYLQRESMMKELAYEQIPEEYREDSMRVLEEMTTEELKAYMDSEDFSTFVEEAYGGATDDSEQAADTAAVTAGQSGYLTEVTLDGESMDTYLGYFFALIGMTCLFGAFQGLGSAEDLQPNVSAIGARRSISPTGKTVQIFHAFFGNLLVEYTCVILLLVYLNCVLKVGFGNHWGGMLLISFMGCVIGISIGILIGCISNLAEGAKIGLCVGIGLVGSMLAGLMAKDVKHIIDVHCPLVNRLNPAAIISDAFYCLSIYNDPARYRMDLILLGGMSVMFLAASYLIIRRERYDSI